jgi:IS30 family transposase
MIKRRRLTHSEQEEVWRNKKSGKSLSEIGRITGRSTSHIRLYVLASGGVAPRARRRSRLALRRAEREEISRGLAAGDSMRSIATALNRSPSTVSREIARHGGRKRYQANAADKAVWIRAANAEEIIHKLRADVGDQATLVSLDVTDRAASRRRLRSDASWQPPPNARPRP